MGRWGISSLGAFVLGVVVSACFSEGSGVGCPPGTDGCRCSAGACNDPGLECIDAGFCVSEDCVDGTENCPCVGNECLTGLVCDGVCKPDETGSTTTTVSTGTTTGSTTAIGTSLGTSGGSTAGSGSTGNAMPAAVFLYATEEAVFGDIGSRAAATDRCIDARPADTGCGAAVALISFNDDTIAGLSLSVIPNDRPVMGPGFPFIPLQTDFPTLLSNGPLESLANAGAALPGSLYWTGSRDNGTIEANCGDWVQGAELDSGAVGAADGGPGTWLSDSLAMCNQPHPLLCACW